MLDAMSVDPGTVVSSRSGICELDPEIGAQVAGDPDSDIASGRLGVIVRSKTTSGSSTQVGEIDAELRLSIKDQDPGVVVTKPELASRSRSSRWSRRPESCAVRSRSLRAAPPRAGPRPHRRRSEKFHAPQMICSAPSPDVHLAHPDLVGIGMGCDLLDLAPRRHRSSRPRGSRSPPPRARAWSRTSDSSAGSVVGNSMNSWSQRRGTFIRTGSGSGGRCR